MTVSLLSKVKLKWRDYSAQYLKLSQREQILILVSGLIGIIFILFRFVIEPQAADLKNIKNKINQTTSTIKLNANAIASLEGRLLENPNDILKKQRIYYEQKISKVDKEILTLTSGLIDPIQMRHALIGLLKLQKGVSLLSFELLGAEALILPQTVETSRGNTTQADDITKTKSLVQSSFAEAEDIGLYKHGVKIKLKGNYFQLRDYLKQLENLQWKFFWDEFNYQLIEYPNSELDIEIFSLSTQEEFVGV